MVAFWVGVALALILYAVFRYKSREDGWAKKTDDPGFALGGVDIHTMASRDQQPAGYAYAPRRQQVLSMPMVPAGPARPVAPPPLPAAPIPAAAPGWTPQPASPAGAVVSPAIPAAPAAAPPQQQQDGQQGGGSLTSAFLAPPSVHNDPPLGARASPVAAPPPAGLAAPANPFQQPMPAQGAPPFHAGAQPHAPSPHPPHPAYAASPPQPPAQPAFQQPHQPKHAPPAPPAQQAPPQPFVQPIPPAQPAPPQPFVQPIPKAHPAAPAQPFVQPMPAGHPVAPAQPFVQPMPAGHPAPQQPFVQPPAPPPAPAPPPPPPPPAAPILPPAFEIEFGEIKLGKQVGSGAFGKVYRATWRGTDVAVKLFQANALSTDVLNEFRKEVGVLASLRHPQIILFMAACTRPPDLAIVTEFCGRGSLWDVIHSAAPLDFKMIVKISTEIARGMLYLHSSGLIHRDLKSANILLDDNWSIKISDFGLTRLRAHMDTVLTGQSGTYQWMAPEVLNNQRYSEKADVFSFGIVLYELITRKLPYEGLDGMQAALGVLHRGLRPDIPPSTSPVLAKLMRSCWAQDPRERPAFEQILQTLRFL
eukprot:tig00021616_g22919.t1